MWGEKWEWILTKRDVGGGKWERIPTKGDVGGEKGERIHFKWSVARAYKVQGVLSLRNGGTCSHPMTTGCS